MAFCTLLLLHHSNTTLRSWRTIPSSFFSSGCQRSHRFAPPSPKKVPFTEWVHWQDKALSSEMKRRIPATIFTPPERWGPWLYYQYIPEGKEYPVLCRKLETDRIGWLKTFLHYAIARSEMHQIYIQDLKPWYFPLPSNACSSIPGSNHDSMNTVYRVVVRSPVMPDVIVDYDMSRHTYSIVHQEEVICDSGGHKNQKAHSDESPSSQIRWTKPELGWVKLNVDGSRDHTSHPPSAGCGGVLRDASGKWLLGFAQKLDPSFEVHQTELEAILKGLELAWDMNVEKLVVESDSESAVSMVENGLGGKCDHPQFNVISRIRQLRFDSKWEVKAVHIPREANRVANRLAKDSRDLPFEYLHKYPYPPANCATLIEEDAQAG